MGSFETTGLEDLQKKLLARGEKVDKTVEKMLEAQAEVYVQNQKQTIQRMGLKDTGGFENSIKAGKIKRDNEETYVEIYPEGRAPHGADYGGGYSTIGETKKGKGQGGNVRYATIGYIFQYGTSSIPAQPWFTEANEKSHSEAYEAARKIWEEVVW